MVKFNVATMRVASCNWYVFAEPVTNFTRTVIMY